MITISQLDADLAALESIDLKLNKDAVELESAFSLIKEITTYGITAESHAKLLEFHPELSECEIQLSATPVLLGTEKLGNEAVGGLSAIALAGIMTAIAAALAWIIAKIFGGTSGSGFGGGRAAILDDAKIPFAAKEMVAYLDSTKGGSKKNTDIAIDQAKIKNAATTLSLINDGSMTEVLKVVAKLIAESAKLRDDGADGLAVLDFMNKSAAPELNKILALIGDYSTPKRKAVPIATQTNAADWKAHLDEFIKRADLNFAPAMNPTKYPATVDIDNRSIVAVGKEIDGLKKVVDTQSKVNKKAEGAATDSVRVLISFTNIMKQLINTLLIKQISNASMSVKSVYDGLTAIAKSSVSIVNSLSDINKGIVLKAAGVSEDDLLTLVARIDKGDVDAVEESTKLLNALSSKVTLTDDQKARLKLK